MRKKVLVVLFAFVVFVAMALTGCGGGGSSEEGGGDGGTIRLCNNKVEVDKQYKDLAAAYKEATGVTVEIESIGGGQDNLVANMRRISKNICYKAIVAYTQAATPQERAFWGEVFRRTEERMQGMYGHEGR